MTRDPGVDVARFRAAVARAMGLQFDAGKQEFLAGVLARRLAATRLEPDTYLERLASGVHRTEVAALAPELTTPETYFFRHTAQFQALTRRALPDRVAARQAERCVRLLSAGCASGEEAYSLAIAARDIVPAGWDVVVRGVDVNAAVIEQARRGRYTEWALRETTPEQERRWFTRRGRERELDASIRGAVRFETRNLIEDDAELWAPGSYDIVFLRNVLMYFEPAQARTVLGRVTRALCPGGFLFLGHAETIRGLSSAFALCHTDEAFYYQRLEGAAQIVGTWTEPVGSATAPLEERLADRTPAPVAIPVAVSPPAPVPAQMPVAAPSAALWKAAAEAAVSQPTWDLAAIRACLSEERYRDAAAAIDALPAAAASDPEVLLHVAVVETHRGRLPEAEAACQRLLDADPFNAGAHYVLALCHEAAGHPVKAEHHDQVAIYLDPAFAMPHLHLGLLARRRGERGVARRTLEQAATLLQREPTARLLLFGGGFGRESLVALCRTEIGRLEQTA